MNEGTGLFRDSREIAVVLPKARAKRRVNSLQQFPNLLILGEKGGMQRGGKRLGMLGRARWETTQLDGNRKMYCEKVKNRYGT